MSRVPSPASRINVVATKEMSRDGGLRWAALRAWQDDT